MEKSKREATFVLEGSDAVFSSSLTEVGRYVDDGWKMTGEEWAKIKFGDPVLIHSKSGEPRLAGYMTGASPYSAKVIFAGETELTSVAAINIGPSKYTGSIDKEYSK